MSYKGAANKVSYLGRRANHSTKPRKTGDNATLATQHFEDSNRIAEEGKELQRIAQLHEDKNTLANDAHKIALRLKKLKELLAEKLPFKEFEELRAEREALIRKRMTMDAQLSSIRAELKNVNHYSSDSFDVLFVNMARQILPNDLYQMICDAVRKAKVEAGHYEVRKKLTV